MKIQRFVSALAMATPVAALGTSTSTSPNPQEGLAALYKTSHSFQNTTYLINDTRVDAQWSYYMYWDNPEWHYHTEKMDFECETYSSVFYPYTGYRFLRKYELTFALFPVKTSLRFVFCHRGRVVSEQQVWYDEDGAEGRDGQPLFRWDRTFCITEREPFTPDARGCFRMARRARYVDFGAPLYPREAFVGGLFKCPHNGTGDPQDPVGYDAAACADNELVTPAAPLIADEPYAGIFELHNPWKFLYHEPLFYTPDYYSQVYPRFDENWSRYIDINEDYDADSVVISKNGKTMRVPRRHPAADKKKQVAALADKPFDLYEEAKRLVTPHLPRALARILYTFSSSPVAAAQATADSNAGGGALAPGRFARLVAGLGAMPDRRRAAEIYHALVMRANGAAAVPDPRPRVYPLPGADAPVDSNDRGLFGAAHNTADYAARFNNRNGLLARINIFEHYKPRHLRRGPGPVAAHDADVSAAAAAVSGRGRKGAPVVAEPGEDYLLRKHYLARGGEQRTAHDRQREIDRRKKYAGKKVAGKPPALGKYPTKYPGGRYGSSRYAGVE